MSERLEQILDAAYLGAVEALPIGEIRARRAACKEVETGLSYLRRLVQGRLDIIAAEIRRRAEGGGTDDLEALIARLPALLAENTRAPGVGRLTLSFDVGDLDDELVAELDAIASPSTASDPLQLDDETLDAVHDELQRFEHKVSGLRRRLFDRIDALEAELTRRYRTGEATVDSLLS